jgi:hypothetical protein
MKKRHSFVTNSSSASFLIKKKFLTPKQIQQILDPYPEARRNKHNGLFNVGGNLERHVKDWKIIESNETITGFTLMENFEIMKYLRLINVKKEYITYKNHDQLTTEDYREIWRIMTL